MDATTLKPGDRISEYVLDERVGRGGFGDVWRAHHHAWSERVVAVKIPSTAERAGLLKREGVLQDRVRHPSAVEILGMDADHDPPYLIMEFVDGESLRARIAREKRLEPAGAIEIAVQVLGALAHAHDRGVVHRDIKPENVLLTRSGAAKLTDFGLGRMLEEERAKLAVSGSLASTDGRPISGTLAYMAPEQREPGRPVDARADLYAFGILLFEMLTGARPEGGEKPSDLVAGLDPRLDAVFARCYCRLEKRYATATAIVTDLAPLATRSAVAAAGGPVALPAAHLEPSVGAPPDARILFLPHEGVIIEGGARIEYRSEAWWVASPPGARKTTVRPAQAPAGRGAHDFQEPVGTAPLRLAEGVVIAVEGDGRVPPMCLIFHDGVPVAREAVLREDAGWAPEGSLASRLFLALAVLAASGSCAGFMLKQFPAMAVLAVGALGLYVLSRILDTPRPAAGSVEPPPADEPPVAMATRITLVGRPAGFFIRGLALMIDLAILVYAAGFSARMGPAALAVPVLYDWLLTVTLGGTVGKYLLGLRVVSDTGEAVGLFQALVRTLSKGLSVVPAGLGFLLAGLTPSKQGLHDFFAGTRVVHRAE